MKKRTIVVLLAVSALVLGLIVAGVLLLLRPIGGRQAPKGDTKLTDYLKTYWSWYALESWDPETGTLTLSAPINATLEQAKKYALYDGVRYDEWAEDDVKNLAAMLRGSDGTDGINQYCGLNVRTILLRRLTTEGEEAYVVNQDGVVSRCWEAPEE